MCRDSKRLKNTCLCSIVGKNWSVKCSYRSIRLQALASRSLSSETLPAGPAGRLAPREWRRQQAEPLRQLHKEETSVKTHERLPEWELTEAQKGEMRPADARRFIVVAVGAVESQWWQPGQPDNLWESWINRTVEESKGTSSSSPPRPSTLGSLGLRSRPIRRTVTSRPQRGMLLLWVPVWLVATSSPHDPWVTEQQRPLSVGRKGCGAKK